MEYLLSEDYYYKWYRHPDSPIEVSGSFYYQEEESPGDGFYLETNWNGQFTFVPESKALSEYLDIDIYNEAGIYSFYLESRSINPSPIKLIRYEDDQPVDSSDNWGYARIWIENEPLPLVGTTLSGSKKLTDRTITWEFTPVE